MKKKYGVGMTATLLVVLALVLSAMAAWAQEGYDITNFAFDHGDGIYQPGQTVTMAGTLVGDAFTIFDSTQLTVEIRHEDPDDPTQSLGLVDAGQVPVKAETVSGDFSSADFEYQYVLMLPGSIQAPDGTYRVIISVPDTTFSKEFTFTAGAAGTPTPTADPGTGNYLGSVTVTLMRPEGADELYYTTDGSDPLTSANRQRITQGVILHFTTTTTLQAVAYANGVAGNVVSYTYTVDPVGTPTVDQDPGNYIDTVTVTLTLPAGVDEMYYTTDGSDPLTSATRVGANQAVQLTFTTTTTLQAVAYANGVPGNVASFTYTFEDQSGYNINNFAFDHGDGIYQPGQSVTMAGTLVGDAFTIFDSTQLTVEIRHEDPDDPTQSLGLVDAGQVPVKAETVSGDFSSADFEYQYVLMLPGSIQAPDGTYRVIISVPDTTFSEEFTFTVGAAGTPTPTVDPGTGNYLGSATVTLMRPEGADELYYTTDGSDPLTSDTRHRITQGVILHFTTTTTLQAVAYAGGVAGNVASYTYTIEPVGTPTVDQDTGNYLGSVTVILTPPAGVDAMYYTTDGSDPETSATRVSVNQEVQLTFTTTTTIRAVASANGVYGDEISETYTIDAVTGPTANPGTGTYLGSVDVTLTPSAGVDAMYYTTDDSDPLTSATRVSANQEVQLTFTTTTTLKAVAYAGGVAGNVVIYTYTIDPVGTPIVDQNTGTYGGSVTVTLTPPAGVDTMYYTTDGSDPQSSATRVSADQAVQLTFTENTTLKAVASANNVFGDLVSNTYTIIGLPSADPGPGTYSGSVTVTMTPPAGVDAMYYTTDDSDPRNSETRMSANQAVQLTFTENTTLKAVASANNVYGDLVSNTYTIVGVPAIDPGTGTYLGSVNVTLTPPAGVDELYYTTDNSDPLTSATRVSANQEVQLTLTTTTTLQAVAYANDVAGDVVSYTYTIVPVGAPTANPETGNYPGSVRVTLTPPAGNGITMYYTTDGSDPQTSASRTSATQTVEFTFTTETTLQAVAYANGVYGDMVSKTYTIVPVAAPTVAQVDGIKLDGIYYGSIEVTLETATPDAAIYYTTDGTEPLDAEGNPVAEAQLYNANDQLMLHPSATTITLKAVASINGVASTVTTSTYAIRSVDAPIADPAPGDYYIPTDGSLPLTLSGMADAKIWYTTGTGANPPDDPAPGLVGTEYTEPVQLAASTVVKAIAVLEQGDNTVVSQVATFTYNITPVDAPPAPDGSKLEVQMNPPGTNDLLTIQPGALEGDNLELLIYTSEQDAIDGVNPLANRTRNGDGTYDPVDLGDNQYSTLYLVARINLNAPPYYLDSEPVTVTNDIVSPVATFAIAIEGGLEAVNLEHPATITVTLSEPAGAAWTVTLNDTYDALVKTSQGTAGSSQVTMTWGPEDWVTPSGSYMITVSASDAAGNPVVALDNDGNQVAATRELNVYNYPFDITNVQMVQLDGSVPVEADQVDGTYVIRRSSNYGVAVTLQNITSTTQQGFVVAKVIGPGGSQLLWNWWNFNAIQPGNQFSPGGTGNEMPADAPAGVDNIYNANVYAWNMLPSEGTSEAPFQILAEAIDLPFQVGQ